MPALSGTTNYPSSLDSHTGASPLGFGEANDQANTLTTASHTNSVTTITVASTSKFPSKGYIVVKREIISYTGTTATTFTGCTRGVGGTTAAAFLSGTLVEQVVVAANHNDLAAAVVAVETQMGAKLAYMPRKNRVINGDMRVKQRPTLGTADDTYTLDRWNLLLEAASAAAVTQETSDVPTNGSNRALKMTVGSGEDNKFGVVTFLEFLDSADLRGKTVSLQAKLKATAAITDVRMAVLEWTGTANSVTSDVVATWGSAGTNPTLAASWAYLGTPANLSVTTSWATYRVEGLTVGASANNLAVFIWCEDETTTVTTDSLLVTDVQLEEGPSCSGFERRPYGHELWLCQRYYQRLLANTQYTPFGNGNLSATTTLDTVVNFAAMRTSPTVIFGPAASDFTVLINGGAAAASAIATAPGTGIGRSMFSVRATIAAQPAVGASGTLASTLTAAYIELSAEL